MTDSRLTPEVYTHQNLSIRSPNPSKVPPNLSARRRVFVSDSLTSLRRDPESAVRPSLRLHQLAVLQSLECVPDVPAVGAGPSRFFDDLREWPTGRQVECSEFVRSGQKILHCAGQLIRRQLGRPLRFSLRTWRRSWRRRGVGRWIQSSRRVDHSQKRLGGLLGPRSGSRLAVWSLAQLQRGCQGWLAVAAWRSAEPSRTSSPRSACPAV